MRIDFRKTITDPKEIEPYVVDGELNRYVSPFVFSGSTLPKGSLYRLREHTVDIGKVSGDLTDEIRRRLIDGGIRIGSNLLYPGLWMPDTKMSLGITVKNDPDYNNRTLSTIGHDQVKRWFRDVVIPIFREYQQIIVRGKCRFQENLEPKDFEDVLEVISSLGYRAKVITSQDEEEERHVEFEKNERRRRSMQSQPSFREIESRLRDVEDQLERRDAYPVGLWF